MILAKARHLKTKGKEAKVSIQSHTFKVLTTIYRGTRHKDKEDLISALRETRIRFSKWVSQVIRSSEFQITEEEQQICLVDVSAESLGFEDGAKRKEIYTAALERGLRKCHAEDGVLLRLQGGDDLEYNVSYHIGMDPIEDSAGGTNILRIENDSEHLWLRISFGEEDIDWPSHSRWVFELPT